MRIIAGEKKGMRLDAPKGDKTRPTGDKAKEALFSIIQPRLAAAAVLDLFAGSGQIGLEALSRGAARSVFVENSAYVRRILQSNIRRTGYDDRADVLPFPAERACRQLAATADRFDFIYLDPPWDRQADMMARLDPYLAGLLTEDGLLVMEVPKTLETAPSVTGLEYRRHCRYGGAMLFFYQKMAGAHA